MAAAEPAGTPSTTPELPISAGDNQEAIKTLNKIIKDCRTCMLTTQGEHGLHSRPMATAGIDFDHNEEHIYFVTDRGSVKVEEIKADPRIALVFSNDAQNSWATVSAHATVVDDPAKIKELWNPIYHAYFPGGPESPEVVLVRCEPTVGSYWQGSHLTRLHIMFSALKARITGKAINQGISQEQKTAVFASPGAEQAPTGQSSAAATTPVA